MLIISDNQNPNTISALGIDVISIPIQDKIVLNSTYFPNACLYGSHTVVVCASSRTPLTPGTYNAVLTGIKKMLSSIEFSVL